MIVLFTMKGVQDLVEVFEDKITIKSQGIIGFFNKGLKGTKTIPVSSITAIQIKECGVITNGYLQFSILGGNENKGGIMSAVRDENTIMFGKKRIQSHGRSRSILKQKYRNCMALQKE